LKVIDIYTKSSPFLNLSLKVYYILTHIKLILSNIFKNIPIILEKQRNVDKFQKSFR